MSDEFIHCRTRVKKGLKLRRCCDELTEAFAQDKAWLVGRSRLRLSCPDILPYKERTECPYCGKKLDVEV